MKYLIVAAVACLTFAAPAMAQIDLELGRGGPGVHIGRPVVPNERRDRDEGYDSRKGRDCHYENQVDQNGRVHRERICTDHHFR